ncbi:MAG TPA: energy transducer TonB [Candidatus Acidoferrales bacterium]|nr:energy transducer TonB [Candidatus Acidoferrales bacterium]
MSEIRRPQSAGHTFHGMKLTRNSLRRESQLKVFLSNLKEFLTERPVKLAPRRGYDAFEPVQFGSSFKDNFKEWLRPLPPSARRMKSSDLLVSSKSWFAAFFENVRDAIAPRKLPPLKVTSKPVAVPEIWSKNQQFTRVQAFSFAFHVLVIVLVILPLLPEFLSPPTQAAVTSIPISPYLPLLKMGLKKAGGGGGRAGDQPTTQGKLPKFAKSQFTPPLDKPLVTPKLPMTATVVVPNITMSNPNLVTTGDPLSKLLNDSNGTGSGTGLGSGNGSGIGPGEGYGVGGGPPEAGQNGYGKPDCLYCPTPPFSDAAFKLKIQGVVVLDAVIGADGRATNIHLSKGLGYGLDESAIKYVRDIWRFKPAIGPDGRPAAVHTLVEVDFNIY